MLEGGGMSCGWTLNKCKACFQVIFIFSIFVFIFSFDLMPLNLISVLSLASGGLPLAQTVLRLDIRSCVQDISLVITSPFALMCPQFVWVIAQGRHVLVNATTLNRCGICVQLCSKQCPCFILYGFFLIIKGWMTELAHCQLVQVFINEVTVLF